MKQTGLTADPVRVWCLDLQLLDHIIKFCLCFSTVVPGIRTPEAPPPSTHLYDRSLQPPPWPLTFDASCNREPCLDQPLQPSSPFAPDSTPTSAIQRLSSISMATADQMHPNPNVKHPLCKPYVIDFPLDMWYICQCPCIVPDPVPLLPPKLARLRNLWGDWVYDFRNAARLDHRASRLKRLHTVHTLPSSSAECIQWTCSGIMPSPHSPSDAPILLVPDGLGSVWLEVQDGMRCGSGEGRCYLAQIPPANTPRTPSMSLHTPPGMDSTPLDPTGQGGRKSMRLFPRTWTCA